MLHALCLTILTTFFLAFFVASLTLTFFLIYDIWRNLERNFQFQLIFWWILQLFSEFSEHLTDNLHHSGKLKGKILNFFRIPNTILCKITISRKISHVIYKKKACNETVIETVWKSHHKQFINFHICFNYRAKWVEKYFFVNFKLWVQRVNDLT